MTTEEQQQGVPDCCSDGHEATIARHFDNRDFSDAPQLHTTSARLLEQLRDVGDLHPTILELGSGAGALAVALLEDGADHATGLDLSPISVDAARRHAAESGVTDRASFSVGDGAISDLQPHDWVVMDRIICCYHDMERLLGNALPAVRRRLAVSVPESRGVRGLVNQILWRLDDALDALRGDRCPGHVHDIRRMHRIVTDAGLRLRTEQQAGLWYTAVFERA